MLVRFISTAVCIALLILPPTDCFARGGGGGARGGGGGARPGGGGGGFSGGARPSSGGGFSGGARPSPGGGGFSGGSRAPSGGGGFQGGSRAPSGGGGFQGGSRGPSGGFNDLGGNNFNRGDGNFGGQGAGNFDRGAGNFAGDRQYNRPSDNQLNNFLGLPSDEGLGGRGGAQQFERPAQQPDRGGNLDWDYGTAEGPRGGQAAGIKVTGPDGNTAGKAAGVGPNGGAAAVGGVKGADGGAAARGVAVRPDGTVTAGAGVRGPGGNAAAGFARVSPSGRYTAAASVRTNYNHWGVYNQGWYTNHPGAWFAAGWAAGSVWNACTWNTCAGYCGYYETAPVYYDYGTNVTYQDDGVYVNGSNVGTSEQYYDQASTIATTGAESEASTDGDWMPLGVFALVKPGSESSDVTVQLAINKEGVIRGNYTDNVTNKSEVIQGSADKQTQRVAFTVGSNTTNIVETGLYNLTKDEAPVLIHFGKDRTEQWLLVRLNKPADDASTQN